MLKKIILIIIISAITFFAYSAAHANATATRGYESFGGECSIFVIPFLGWVAYDTAKISKRK